MAINKVEYGDETLMDLTEDTVTEEQVLEGATFHNRAGEKKTGTLAPLATSVNEEHFNIDESKQLSLADEVTKKLSDVDELTNEVSSLASVNASKNMLQIKQQTGTYRGITYTVNDNGTVIEGTAEGGAAGINIAGTYVNIPLKLKKGTYVVSGITHGTQIPSNEISFYLQKTNDPSTRINIYSNGGEFTLNEDTEFYVISLRIPNGATVDCTDYPMLRLASISDDTYEPYRGKSNLELTEELDSVYTDSNVNLIDTANFIKHGISLKKRAGVYSLFINLGSNVEMKAFTVYENVIKLPFSVAYGYYILPTQYGLWRITVKTDGYINVQPYSTVSAGNYRLEGTIVGIVTD